jgi:hypothetical protein
MSEAAVATQSIYEELLGAAQTLPTWEPRKAGESTPDYLYRLVLAVKEVSEPEWNKLTESTTHVWFNSAAAILNAGQPLNDCPGFTDGGAPAKAAKEPKAPKAAKAPKEPKPVKEKVAASEGASSRGIIVVLREAVIKNPAITGEQMKAVAIEAGFTEPKPSTISTIRTDTLSTINMAKRLGYWNDAPKA